MSRLATRQNKIESLMSKHQRFESILNQVNKSISVDDLVITDICLLYTSPSPRDPKTSRMPSSA